MRISEHAKELVNIARLMVIHLQKRKNQFSNFSGLVLSSRVAAAKPAPRNDIVDAKAFAGDGEKPVTYKNAESGTVRRSESASRYRTKTPMFASLFALRSSKKMSQLRSANNFTNSEVIGARGKHRNLPQKSAFFTLVFMNRRISQVQHSTPNIEALCRNRLLVEWERAVVSSPPSKNRT